MIASTVRSFVANEIFPHEAAVKRTGCVPRELGDKIKRECIELGIHACTFPEEVCGAGLSHLDFTLVKRELGRGSMAQPHFLGRPRNILMACDAEQRERYLLPALRGEKMYALAMTALRMSVVLPDPLDYHTHIWADEDALTRAFSAMMLVSSQAKKSAS